MKNYPISTHAWTLLKKYIELDTSLSDGRNFPTAINLLSQFLMNAKFDCTQITIPEKIAGGPNRVHLIARRMIDPSFPTLLMYNHVDVVPATYPDAFSFRFDEKKVFGRGACDHKGSTAVVLSALEKLKDTQLRFNIIFLATTDEETDQKEQLKFISSKLNVPNDTLIFDPDTFAGGVTTAHLGCLQLEITLHGRSAHSAASHFGINAVEQAGIVFDFFREEKKHQEAIVSKQTPFPSSKALHIVSRCNVNMISGGIAPNVIPDICHLTVDYRFIPEASVAQEKINIFERFEHFCHKHQISAKIEAKSEFEGYSSHHSEMEILNQIYAKYSKESGLYCVMGSTPAADWAKELGLPHFGIGVARGDTLMHGVGEFAYIEDLISLEKTLIEYIKK